MSVYQLDGATGAPTEAGGSPFPAGGRPRSIALLADNRFAYAANRDTNDISAYRVNEFTGALTELSGSPFATGLAPNGIAAHPAGTFVFVATSDNGVMTYAVNSTTGALTNVGTSVPGVGSIAIHPSGNFAYATRTSTTPGVFAYAIDHNGALTSIGGSPFAAGNSPVAVVIDPAGKFAYVANQNSSNVSAYSISATTGALAQIAGSPFATAVGPRALAIDPQSAFLYVASVGNPTNFGALSGYSINNNTGALTQVLGSPFHTKFSVAVGVDRSGKFAYDVAGSATIVNSYDLHSYSIGGTGALTQIPGSPLVLGTGGALGVVLTR